MFMNVYLSLTNWDGYSQPRFIGLDNYVRFVADPITYISFFNTLLWVALALSIPVLLGLLVAVLVDGKRFESAFKVILFTPFALSGVVIGLMWRFVYDPTYGVLNTSLQALGLDYFARPWLGLPTLNSFCMIAAYSWSQVGFSMVIFLAGLRNVPLDLVEASKVDGATEWQAFRNVKFPLLLPFTTVAIAMTILNTLKVFDIIYIMTTGGPYRTSETLAMTMFFDAFSLRAYGYGSAVGTVLFLVVIAVTVAYLYLMFKREVQY